MLGVKSAGTGILQSDLDAMQAEMNKRLDIDNTFKNSSSLTAAQNKVTLGFVKIAQIPNTTSTKDTYPYTTGFLANYVSPIFKNIPNISISGNVLTPIKDTVVVFMFENDVDGKELLGVPVISNIEIKTEADFKKAFPVVNNYGDTFGFDTNFAKSLKPKPSCIALKAGTKYYGYYKSVSQVLTEPPTTYATYSTRAVIMYF